MKQFSENGWIWFTNAVSLRKPRRKRSNRKMCAKRAGEGVSPVVTILQMDFQGRGEIVVAKTWLVRYNKRNVIAFSIEWVSFTNTGGTADRMICPVSKWFDTGLFLPRKAIQTRDKEKERKKWKLYRNWWQPLWQVPYCLDVLHPVQLKCRRLGLPNWWATPLWIRFAMRLRIRWKS